MSFRERIAPAVLILILLVGIAFASYGELGSTVHAATWKPAQCAESRGALGRKLITDDMRNARCRRVSRYWIRWYGERGGRTFLQNVVRLRGTYRAGPITRVIGPPLSATAAASRDDDRMRPGDMGLKALATAKVECAKRANLWVKGRRLPFPVKVFSCRNFKLDAHAGRPYSYNVGRVNAHWRMVPIGIEGSPWWVACDMEMWFRKTDGKVNMWGKTEPRCTKLGANDPV